MKDIGQIDLGATILSIAVAAGFVAFAILLFRLVVTGISKGINLLKSQGNAVNISSKKDLQGFKPKGDDGQMDK
ncbi:hypothetical protein [Prochlorococcus marinus]|uniref:hypothetical protein n=1 Tax=Prochlorococcus marinus TaxID=1219 RepID=UPI000067291C|nr:hypothetical protein [Prochlorococcus marinus]